MHASNCLNCAQPLEAQQKFCAWCGQKTDIHRLTVGHLVHEFFHAFTHTDKGIFHLVKELALRPGRMAGAYVAGKRKKYFNPFTFFLLCVGFMVFVNNMVKPFPAPRPDPNIVAQLKNEQQRRMYITTTNRSADAVVFVNKNANLIYMLAVPFYALVFWIFFRKRGRNYAELTTAMILFTAFSNLVFTLVASPLMAAHIGKPAYFQIMAIGMFVMTCYYAWAMKGFLGYRSFLAGLRVFGATVCVFLIWNVLTFVCMFYYMFRENTGKIVGKLVQGLA